MSIISKTLNYIINKYNVRFYKTMLTVITQIIIINKNDIKLVRKLL